MADEGDDRDSTRDMVWVSKVDLAQARGISISSVEKLSRRRGWKKQPGNDGKTRVLVPRSVLGDSPADMSRDTLQRRPVTSPATVPVDVGADNRAINAAVEAAIDASVAAWRGRAEAAEARVAAADAVAATLGDALAVIRTDMERERARADKAEEQIIAADARADRFETEAREVRTRLDWTEGQAEAERGRADRAVAALTAEQAARASAEAKIAGLQHDQAERRRTWLARITAALRRK
jgi:hypothetical protein